MNDTTDRQTAGGEHPADLADGDAAVICLLIRS